MGRSRTRAPASQQAQTDASGTRGVRGPFAKEVAAHEQIHRAQFNNPGRPVGSRDALEAEADRGTPELLSGRGFTPALAASPGLVLGHPGMTPQRMISDYTSFWTGLDTNGLGTRLFEIVWMSPRHYDFARRVLVALAPRDQDDDVALRFANCARDEDLRAISRTSDGRRLLRQAASSLASGYVAGSERRQAVRLTRAADLGEGLVDGQRTGMSLLQAAATAPLRTAPGVPATLTVGAQRSRLDLIQVSVMRLVTSTSADVRRTATGLTTDILSLRALLERPGGTASATIAAGLPIVRRSSIALARLDQQLAVYLDPSGTLGPKAAAYAALTRFVRTQYLTALQRALRPGAAAAFNRAEQVAERLPRALMEVDLAVLGSRSNTYNLLGTRRGELLAGVRWAQAQLAALDVLGEDIARHRRAGRTPPTALVDRFQTRREVLGLTVQALGYMEMGFSAYEYLAGGGNLVVGGYQDCANILSNGKAMLDQARAWQLTALRARLRRHQTDPGLVRFQRALPAYVQYSNLVTGLTVTLVAAVATAGVGSVVTGALGATATTGLAVAGTAALEALTFTVVHRGLSTHVGQDPTSGFWADLIWNFGLFTLMRGMGGAIHTRLNGTALQALEAPIQMGANVGLLGAYGVLRFSVEQGRAPTSAELSRMGAETVIMVAAIALTTRGIGRAGQAWARHRQLRILRDSYGAEFYALEASRVGLQTQLRAAIARGEADPAVLNGLRQRLVRLEDGYRTLTQRITSEGRIRLPELRTELESYLGQTETASGLLTESLGLPANTLVRPGGTPSDFTIATGTADAVAASHRLQGLTVDVTQVRGPLRAVTVTRPGQPSLVFVERAPSLTTSSLVVDANVAIALQKRAAGLPLQTGETALLGRLDSLTSYTDLRLTETAANESGSPMQRVEVTVARADPTWQAIHSQLETAAVGRSKGANDRLIIADLFFAQTDGSTPTFATMDRGIYNPMALLAGHNPAKMPLLTRYANGFDVTLHGRTIRVIPLPNR